MRFRLRIPNAGRTDVELVHPHLRALRLQIFREAKDEFRVFAAVADEGSGRVDGQCYLLAREPCATDALAADYLEVS